MDAWGTVEQRKLQWLKANQTEMRLETIGGLQSALADGLPLHRIGQRTILPASHMGSPRYMYQTYQDCMAIVRRFGKPSLFITMTSNPKWREIQEQLLPGQTSSDRPDITARVFRLKLSALMQDLRSQAYFGKVLAFTYVVEYQKRGLPHAHILLILEPGNRPQDTADMDTLVCAELPDPNTHPQLWATVTSCMLHGPCGPAHPECPCMVDGRCKSRYPRPYQDQTTLGEHGYPTYRRRPNGRSFTSNGHTFTNQWVVPYNPLLAQRYDCHINVEVATEIGAVKYLFKYVYKGNDRSSFVLHPEDEAVDEIKDYLDGRYISPAEACYRLFKYDLSEHGPSVYRLAVHLPSERTVMFRPTSDARATLQQIKPSTLEAFFHYCRQNPLATRNLLYPDAPETLTWKPSGHWVTRASGRQTIGRVLYVPPAQNERYCLRMLLYHVPGPTSFAALRTVNGVEYPTFKEACRHRGLLNDDQEHDHCLQEAALFKTAGPLRVLFMTIIIHSTPTDPLALYERHKDSLFEDCRHRLQQRPYLIAHPTCDEILAYGLGLLSRLAEQHGKTMTELQLPEPPPMASLLETSALIADERAYHQPSLEAELQAGLATANSGQRQAYEAVMDSVTHNAGRLFFLDGPGGTGKTFIERLCLAAVRRTHNIALAVASSGVASLLLPGGRTAHSRFKIPLDAKDTSTCAVSAQSMHAELFRQTKLIIWDEAVMQHWHCFAAVNRMLQDVREDERPFGGITVVFAGDLRQCLPVVPKGSRSEILSAALVHAPFWPLVTTLPLSENMRLAGSPDPLAAARFSEWLLAIGEGNLNSVEGLVTLPAGMCLPNGASRCDLVHHIYGDLSTLPVENPPALADYFGQRVILAPHNKSVDALNDMIGDLLPGERQVCTSADTAVEDNNQLAAVPTEYLNQLCPAGMPAHKLNLKRGSPIILIRNLAPADGLCNGTRLLVHHVGRRVLSCTILAGARRGQEVLLPRIRLISNPQSELPFALHRVQFPIRPAFAMTINKAQGQSLPNAGLDLSLACFAHGQLYVGLSRSTRPDSIQVLLPDDAYGKTDNIVYPEVLEKGLAAQVLPQAAQGSDPPSLSHDLQII